MMVAIPSPSILLRWWPLATTDQRQHASKCTSFFQLLFFLGKLCILFGTGSHCNIHFQLKCALRLIQRGDIDIGNQISAHDKATVKLPFKYKVTGKESTTGLLGDCLNGKGHTIALSCCVTTVTFCNPHQHIPKSSASFPSPQAQSRNPTLIPNSERPFPITLDHSWPNRAQPNRLYLSLVSSSSLSLVSSHTLPLPLSCSLRLTLLVLCLRQPYTT